MVNLTKHEELTADGKTLLEFRHNAYGDPENKSLYGYVSFPLKELFNEVTDSVQLHISTKVSRKKEPLTLLIVLVNRSHSDDKM